MGRLAIFFGVILFFFGPPASAGDILTAHYLTDINKDGKEEHLIHNSFGGSGSFGQLKIYTNKGKLIFSKLAQGDPYLWDSDKMKPGLSAQFFQDVDGDGIVEIFVGHSERKENIALVDQQWWHDVFRWDGHKYRLMRKIWDKTEARQYPPKAVRSLNG